MVSEGVLYNCSATIAVNKEGVKAKTGNVSEIGLINYLEDSGYDVEGMLKDKKNIDPIFAIPFSSKRKR